MKFKFLIITLFIICISIFAIDSYHAQPNRNTPARSIFPVSVNPLACKENEVFYNMTTHQFLVCTGLNTLSTVAFGSGSGGSLASLNGLTASIQSFTAGSSGTNFNISSSGSTHTFNIPTASGVNRGLLSSSDWLIFNNKQPALGFTPENVANKDATNGYAGLSNGKLALSQLQEVASITDLTDYITVSGTGTTAIKVTLTSIQVNDCLLWDGTNWVNSATCGGGGGGGITNLNGLVALSQTFATGTSGTDFTISSSSSTHTFNLPSASASNRGLLLAADWSTFNNKQAALGFTAENSANKNVTNGYAGLSSGKVASSQLTEVLGIADLSDFASKSGNGTTAIGATITSIQVNQCLIWNGSAWINSSSCAGDMQLASTQTVTGPKTFNAGTLIVGTNAGAPSIVANSFYRDTNDGKLYVGKSDGSSWNELFEAGVSLVNLTSNVTGVLPNANGGRTKASGAPVGACTTGDLYTRTDGGVGSTLYVCEASSWAAK